MLWSWQWWVPWSHWNISNHHDKTERSLQKFTCKLHPCHLHIPYSLALYLFIFSLGIENSFPCVYSILCNALKSVDFICLVVGWSKILTWDEFSFMFWGLVSFVFRVYMVWLKILCFKDLGISLVTVINIYTGQVPGLELGSFILLLDILQIGFYILPVAFLWLVLTQGNDKSIVTLFQIM